ncbi:hypothetical protein JCM30237_02740 [Halolamina litorea]|uniref:YbhN family protein n=1 Tax=Halolamina litorea TaxID=1515593 RepID=A0ABD6BS72_9EURY|nr:lysylphosphatidylglycerol synthase transmembrane domain-containing protein [Halolamina litorea]
MTTVADRETLLKSGAGFALAGLVIYLFGRVLGWAAVTETLGEADPRWIAAGAASTLLCLGTWTGSWQRVLAGVGVRIPWSSLVVDYYAATFVNYVTPLGRTSGAPVSAYVLSTDHRAPYREALATVATVSTFNVAPMLTFAGVGALAVARRGDVPGEVTPFLAAIGGLCVALPLLALVLWHQSERVVGTVTRAATWLSARTSHVDPTGIERRVTEFFLLLDRFGNARWRLVELFVLSYVGWTLFAAPMWFAAKALGVHLDPLLVAFVVPTSTLASVVPTPGGVGGVEAAIVGLLTGLTGVSAATAGAIALLYRLSGYWFVIAVGGLAALRVGARSSHEPHDVH